MAAHGWRPHPRLPGPCEMDEIDSQNYDGDGVRPSLRRAAGGLAGETFLPIVNAPVKVRYRGALGYLRGFTVGWSGIQATQPQVSTRPFFHQTLSANWPDPKGLLLGQKIAMKHRPPTPKSTGVSWQVPLLQRLLLWCCGTRVNC